MLGPRLSRFVQIMSLLSVFIAPVLLVNFLALDWLIYRGLKEAEQAELFPPPLDYLDALETPMEELYYPPDQPAYCWGEAVTWTTNALARSGVMASVSYYLQAEHRYAFTGPEAERLEAAYPGEKREVVSLFERTGDVFHLREGTFIGGARRFRLPTLAEMDAAGVDASRLEPGTPLRLYIEIDAPFSRSAGYHLDFELAAGCEKGTS